LALLISALIISFLKQRILTAIGGAGGDDDTGRNPPTDGHGTRGVGATVAPLGPNGNAE
jgi:hypothetical protein